VRYYDPSGHDAKPVQNQADTPKVPDADVNQRVADAMDPVKFDSEIGDYSAAGSQSGQADFIVGPNGDIVTSQMYNMSNADFIQEVADISNKKINEQLIEQNKPTTGHVAGTLKHSEAQRIIDSYQDNIASRGLLTEQNYLDHIAIPNNIKDSTRIDAYDTTAGQVYDFKFVINPGKGLSSGQINKILSQGPLGVTEGDIHEVNPR